MKRASECLALLGAIGLGACTIATEVEVFNNSPSLVRLAIDNDESELQTGKATTFYEHEFRRVVVARESTQWTYELNSSIPESFIIWRGWGWWQSRIARVQIESDSRIWLLGADQSFPVSSFVDQPEGFPLVPNIL